MSKPEFFAPPGYGEFAREKAHYSQAVRIGNRIEISGQGGWSDDDKFEFPQALQDEIIQAFDNVTRTLAAAGAGWEHVIAVNSYHVNFTPDVNDIMVALFKKHMPHHQPLWTLLGVAALGNPGMRVEIRVTAITD